MKRYVPNFETAEPLARSLRFVAAITLTGVLSFGTVSAFAQTDTPTAPDGTAPAAAPGDAPAGGEAVDPPKNLARSYGVGTSIEAFSTKPDGSVEHSDAAAGNLLTGEPSKNFKLPVGTTVVIMDLKNGYNLQSLKFRNGGATGDVSIAMASTKPDNDKGWTSNPAPVSMGGAGAVDLPLSNQAMRYVKLTFNVKTPGEIGSMGVFSDVKAGQMPVIENGAQKVSAAQKLNPQVQPIIPVNMASEASGAKVVYVSSQDKEDGAGQAKGNDPQNLVSEDTARDFRFHSDDASPITAVKMADSRKVTKLEMTLTNPVGMHIYLSDAAPAPGSSWKDLIQKRSPNYDITKTSKVVSVDLRNEKALYVVVAFQGNPGPIADLTILANVPATQVANYAVHNAGPGGTPGATAAGSPGSNGGSTSGGGTGGTDPTSTGTSTVGQRAVSIDNVPKTIPNTPTPTNPPVVTTPPIPPVVPSSN